MLVMLELREGNTYAFLIGDIDPNNLHSCPHTHGESRRWGELSVKAERRQRRSVLRRRSVYSLEACLNPSSVGTGDIVFKLWQ